MQVRAREVLLRRAERESKHRHDPPSRDPRGLDRVGRRSTRKPVAAYDRLIEGNQPCAVQTGCLPADPPAFPVDVSGSAGSSDRLTGDLTIDDATTTGSERSERAASLDVSGH